MEKYVFLKKIFAKYIHFNLFYVLNYSGPIEMHIAYQRMKQKTFFVKSRQKTVFALQGGLAQNFTNRSATNRVFIVAFPYMHTKKKG